MKGIRRKVGGALLLVGAVSLGGGLLLDDAVSAQEGNSPEVECAGNAFVVKFVFTNGVASASNDSPQPNAVTLTDTGDPNTSPRTWSWTSTVPIGRIVLKGGSADDVVTHNPAVQSGTLSWPEPPAISHMTFCGPGGTTTSSSTSSTSSTTSSTSSTTATTLGTTTTVAPTTTAAPTTTTAEGVLPTQLEQTTSTTGAVVAGVQQVRTLPRTGLDSTAVLLVLGLGLVAAGTCVLRTASATAR